MRKREEMVEERKRNRTTAVRVIIKGTGDESGVPQVVVVLESKQSSETVLGGIGSQSSAATISDISWCGLSHSFGEMLEVRSDGTKHK